MLLVKRSLIQYFDAQLTTVQIFHHLTFFYNYRTSGNSLANAVASADKDANIDEGEAGAEKNANAYKGVGVGKNINGEKDAAAGADKGTNAVKGAGEGKNTNAAKDAGKGQNTNADKNVNSGKNAQPVVDEIFDVK